MYKLTILLLFYLITQGCKTYSYFNSPNNLLNESCQVFLNDGTEVDGKLTIQFETGHDNNKLLKIITNTTTDKEILATDIKYYKYNNALYFPKAINLEAYQIPYKDKLFTPDVNNILFLKRLTNDSAKLQLFELYRSKNNSLEEFDQYDYYVSFSNENRFVSWSIRGIKFFPDFEDKMSKIVSDCPLLAEKIEQKQNGYALKQVSLDAKKNEVIKRIVEEYNKCR